MHKRRNRVAMVAAAVVSTALVLTGCSTGGGGDAASGTTTVTFWQQKFEDYQGVWFKKYVDAFNKSQDKVHVDYQVIPADTWAQKLQAAQAAGKQPDIATTNYGNIAAGVVNGQFAALDDYMPAESFSDIKENVASFVTIDGKHYAYPMLVEPSTVLYYNTDLVKAAGLDPDSPPTSWAELVDWSTKLTSGDVKGMTIASTAPDLGWSSWGLQYNACGHLPINDDWSKADATDPCFDKLLEFYKTLYQGNLIPQQPKVGYADGSPYGAGEVAMMAGGSWVIGQLKNDFPDMLAKTMVAPFPSIDGDQTKPTATLGGWTLTLDSKSKNPQAAADFIQYLLAGDPAIMSDFFKAAGYSKYTVRTSVDEALASDPDASADPFMKIISDKVVAYGKQEPGYPWDVALAFGTAIESAMKGTDTVEGSLATADAAINDVIAKQGLAGTAPKK
ncbi:MAG: ABC transporter substrate-binding protein [Micrococcales bacterium 70-64]|nr:extracellular solute-binding protein [Leifsonia sp.]ODU63401.1 MAG: ABC transporter substrate-binding protein [Leifsonia sp. SCN 70-46]OJX85092.1 MAG: ABC transporter substrate-binding protein [Micrococcales bacterium 70-64]